VDLEVYIQRPGSVVNSLECSTYGIQGGLALDRHQQLDMQVLWGGPFSTAAWIALEPDQFIEILGEKYDGQILQCARRYGKASSGDD
jgi:hypothetical protein